MAMNFPIEPQQLFAFGLWAVVIITIRLIAILWSSRQKPGGVELINLLMGIMIWVGFMALALSANTLLYTVIWVSFSYVGICTVILYTYLLAHVFSSRDWRIPGWLKGALFIIPVVTVIMVATNPLHGWMWSDLSLDANGVLQMRREVWFWVWQVYANLLTFAALVRLVQATSVQRGMYRRQTICLLLAVLTPWLVNALFVFPLEGSVLPDMYFTPLGFGASVLILAFNHHFFHFLKSLPVACDQVVEAMNQGMLVVDSQLRILDVNQALCRLVAMDKYAMLDKAIGDVFPQYQSQFEVILQSYGDRHTELYFEGLGYLDVHISPLSHRESLLPGWVVLIYDLSPRRKAQQQLQDAHEQLQLKAAELEQAQDTIKSIGDLVPICAWCGTRIEQEDGTWVEVEHFIEEHSHAELTHGLCPVCAAKHED